MLDDREISLSMRAWLVGQFSQYLEMEGRDHAEMYTNVMSALAAKYGESELAGNVYLAWAERLIRQGAFKEAEEKLELARNILGYLVTRDVQLELDGSSRHVTEPPSDYAFYNQAALVWFFPGGPNGYQDVFLAGGVTEAQVEPGHWERAFADAEKVLAEESEPRTRRIVAHLIKVLVLKQQGKYDLVLAELDKTEKECAELEMKGPFEDSFAGEAEFLRGRVLQAQGRQREAQSLYEKMVGNTDLPLSTRQVAVSGLASLIGSRTADGAEKAVAERMQMLMRDAQPAEFKRHIEVAWAEWLIENGNYYAAGKILREAAGVVGEMSADVKEAQFLLKKRGAPKAEEGLSPEP